MANKSINFTPELYQYMLDHSLREPEPLKLLRQATANDPMVQMQIAPEQGQLMALLVKMLHVSKALEIGTYTGYSAMAVALAMPVNGRLVACDISEEWTAIAREHWQRAGVIDKIDLRLAPANKTLDKLLAHGESNSFDFVFIDADKASYADYYEKSLRLLKVGGVILIDNVLLRGQVIDATISKKSVVAMRKFNKQLHHDERIDISILPMSDGITLVRKR